MSVNNSMAIPNKASPPSNRLKSLDALRGFDMFWIMGGTEFIITFLLWIYPPAAPFFQWQFEHCVWDGFTFYDLIFPLFIFMSGISIPFSITRRKEKGDNVKALYFHIFKRAFLLFVLGLAYNSIDKIFTLNFAEIRIMGVLQRIAIAYLVAALLAMILTIKGQAIVCAIILVGYWMLLLFVPVPGVGTYILTPEGNLAFYIDRLLLPGSFCCFPGLGDNEGLLSSIPAIANGILGAMAGHWFRTENSPMKKVQGFLVIGASFIGIGLLWNIVFPINKYLWTSSFAIYSSGWCFILVALFYWIIDIKKWQKWAFFFIVIGMNSILIYLVKGLIRIDGLYPGEPTPIIEFLLWVTNITLAWLILFYLYRKNKFFKV